MTIEEIQEFFIEMANECSYEIEYDYLEKELSKWDKSDALRYFIQFLDFEQR